MRRFLIITCLLIAGLMVTAACAEEPTPTPEPTATPVPTATPTPEPPMAEPFVFAPGVTGADLLSWLSQEEVDCMRGLIGEPGLAGFGAMDLSPSGLSLAPPGGGSQGAPQVASIFTCFSRDNIGAFGGGLYTAWSQTRRPDADPESVSCVVDVLRHNPEMTYAMLRLEDPDPNSQIGHALFSQGLQCLPVDVLNDTVQSWLSAIVAGEGAGASESPGSTMPDPARAGEPFYFADGVTGSDMFAWLSPGEIDCISGVIGEPGMAAFGAADLSPGSPALSEQGLQQGTLVFACFSRENVGALGAGLYTAQSVINGQDPDIYNCIADVLRDNPDISYSVLGIQNSEQPAPFDHVLLDQSLSCMPNEYVDSVARTWLANYLG